MARESPGRSGSSCACCALAKLVLMTVNLELPPATHTAPPHVAELPDTDSRATDYGQSAPQQNYAASEKTRRAVH